MSTVAIVIAARNEGDNIADLVKVAKQYGDVIVVDNASTDDTVSQAKAAGAKVIRHWVNTHIRQSYVDGFKSALRDPDYIIQIDAGGSHDPYDIPRLLRVLKSGKDMVIGSRFVPGGCLLGQSWHRRAISRGAAFLVRRITGMQIRDVTSGFRGFRRRVLVDLHNRAVLDSLWAYAHGFQIEILWHVWRLWYSIEEIPIVYVATRSSANLAAAAEALR